MRFNLFGFKGELSTSGQKKKKGKNTEDDGIVGGTFRVHSEFGPSSSRFKMKPTGAKLQENGAAKNGSVKTQNWCGTPIPKQDVPAPPGGYSAEVAPQENDVKPAASKQLKSNLKKAAPTPPQTEPKVENETKSVNQDIKPEAEEIKIKTIEPKPSSVESNSVSEDEFGAKPSKSKSLDNENQKKVITLDGFDNNGYESADESEDEYGAKKSTKKTEDNAYYGAPATSFEKVQIKQPQESPKAQTPKTNFGYSDQAASIFFRSDSPEPEQRVRNFTIKKGEGDDEDNLSQTSA